MAAIECRSKHRDPAAACGVQPHTERRRARQYHLRGARQKGLPQHRIGMAPEKSFSQENMRSFVHRCARLYDHILTTESANPDADRLLPQQALDLKAKLQKLEKAEYQEDWADLIYYLLLDGGQSLPGANVTAATAESVR